MDGDDSLDLEHLKSQVERLVRTGDTKRLKLVYAQLKAAVDRKQAAERADRWSKDPTSWVRDRLGQTVWSKQAEIMESVRDNRKTVVRSCHSSGKSHVASLTVSWWLDAHPPGDAFVVTCYDDQTEVLTKDGWKLFRDVQTGPDGDLFATRNQITKEFEWQYAFQYHEAPWDGEVVDVRGKSLNLRVTPNHRMLVQWATYKDGVKTAGERLKAAEKIGPRGAELPALSFWKGESPTSVKFGRHEWDSITFASFLGAYVAEGCLGPARIRVKKSGRKSPAGCNEPSGVISLTQLPKTKGYEPYRDLLARMLGKVPHHSLGKTWSFACSDLWHYLKKLGTAETKYIPEEVKSWGRAELEAFLHFYLLGDGWQNRNKAGEKDSWRAVTVSRRLADDLQEIAQKVGLSATITERQPRDACIEGRHIPAERQRVGYYLCFNKAKTRRIRVSRSHYRGKVYCVSVPNEVLYVRRGGSPIWCGNTAPTTAQVRAILWRYIRRMHKENNLPGRVNQTEWLIDEELVAFGRKPADTDEAAFVGIHAPRVLCVLDEACGVPDQLWIGAEAITTGPWCRILAIGNPDNAASNFFKVSQPGSGWNAIRISAFDTPNFTGEPVPERVAVSLVSREWAEEKKKEWGEENALYNSKILGEFTLDSADTVVRSSDVATCRLDTEAAYSPADLSPVELGVDVGGGLDETVIRERRGILAGREWRIRTDRPEKIAPLVLRALRESGATAVKIDSIGVGFGVIGELRNAASRGEHAARIIGVNVSENPRDKKKFANLRAEMWWTIGREMSAQGLWDLSRMENADITCAQLLQPRWELDTKGRIIIEPKDKIRDRTGRSPDNADALLLSYYSGAKPRIRILGG